MNCEQAQAILAKQLRFGDKRQIEAAQYLADYAALKALAVKDKAHPCDGCDGLGQWICDCGDEDCDQCSDGGYAEECGCCNGVGVLNDDGEPWEWRDGIHEDAPLEVIAWLVEQKAVKV